MVGLTVNHHFFNMLPFLVPIFFSNVCALSDGIISVQDILILLSDFGCNSMCEYDINQDGAVSIVDLLMMLQAFGGLCEIP